MQLQVTSQLFRSLNSELESEPAVQDLFQLLVEEAAKWTQQVVQAQLFMHRR